MAGWYCCQYSGAGYGWLGGQKGGEWWEQRKGNCVDVALTLRSVTWIFFHWCDELYRWQYFSLLNVKQLCNNYILELKTFLKLNFEEMSCSWISSLILICLLNRLYHHVEHVIIRLLIVKNYRENKQ